MSSHLPSATVGFSKPGKVSILSFFKKKRRGGGRRVENHFEQKSLWLFCKANLNNKFSGGKVQPPSKWFDLVFASVEEPQRLHFSLLFSFLLGCTDGFCENDTLPGKVTELKVKEYFLL